MKKKTAKKNILMNVSYFFLNYPVGMVRATIWDFYREWVHGSETDNAKEHSDRLLFYENLMDLVEELSRADKVLHKKSHEQNTVCRP